MTMTTTPRATAANTAAADVLNAAAAKPANAKAASASGNRSTDSSASTGSGKTSAKDAGPFARLMAPADEAATARAMSPKNAENAGNTDEQGDANAIDVLDAELMRALDGLLGRDTALAAGESAAIGIVGAVGEGAEGEHDAAKTSDDDQLPAGSTPAALMSMLMPTLLPTAMPPAPAAMRDGSSPSGAATAQASTASAMATDPARLLSLQAQGVSSADASTTAAALNPATVAAGDDGAWQGLQRWSADLMAAMAPASSTPTPGTSTGTTAPSASTLSLPGSRDAWQQPLMQALGDRLQVQIAQRSDSARLHLEPPQLGRIEIDIRQQGGALQVQLTASNDEVRQQLRQIAEPLRHELVQRHAGEVSVQVATGAQAAGDGRGRDGASGQSHAGGQPREGQRQPGRGLGDEDNAGTTGSSGAGAMAFADALAGNTRNTR
jgi:flagellar hook-length control protein FliK